MNHADFSRWLEGFPCNTKRSGPFRELFAYVPVFWMLEVNYTVSLLGQHSFKNVFLPLTLTWIQRSECIACDFETTCTARLLAFHSLI